MARFADASGLRSPAYATRTAFRASRSAAAVTEARASSSAAETASVSRGDSSGEDIRGLPGWDGGGGAKHVRLRDLPPAALLAADANDPVVREAVQDVAAADGVVLLTPIYKAGASGLLKVFLDLLPQHAFAGKTVLPMALCRSMAHLLALDYGLHPVLQSMGSPRVLRSLVLLEEHLLLEECGSAGLVPEGELRLVEAMADVRGVAGLRAGSRAL